MIFKVIGGLLVIWGVLDFGMSTFMSVDIWVEWLGIDLFSISEILWQYIAWVAIIIGGVIWSQGNKDEAADPSEN